MTEKEILNLKKNGNLVAIQEGEFGGWQYWLKDDILYSLSTSGTTGCVWCGLQRLNGHLQKLWQITGRKFFTENDRMVIVDHDFVKQFAFA